MIESLTHDFPEVSSQSWTVVFDCLPNLKSVLTCARIHSKKSIVIGAWLFLLSAAC